LVSFVAFFSRKHTLFFPKLFYFYFSAPSPDWFVGVAALNLCLRNCSWTDSKVIPLYPWDAGTDGGITYLVKYTNMLDIYR
jgi:hypothetical protein